MDKTEEEIRKKNLTAPRVTPERLEEVISDEQFHVFEGTQLTVCVLTLINGFTVTGESACASPENFDAELGQKVARDNAKQKIWVLEGYLLKQQLHEEYGVDYIGRMEVELSELNKKLEKLQTFIDIDLKFSKLSKEQQELMIEQADFMKNYSEVLGYRLEIAKK